MIAGQLRVQSIPTVYAFFQGQLVDAFQGDFRPARSSNSSKSWSLGDGRRAASPRRLTPPAAC